MDNRPAIEQVKSGFKIVGAILTSFAAMVLVSVGYLDITNPEKHRVGLGWVLLLATIVTMFFTVRFLGELVLRHSQLPSCTVYISHILCSKRAIVTLDRHQLDPILLVDGDSRYSVLS
jgi:hypothetical protein